MFCINSSPNFRNNNLYRERSAAKNRRKVIGLLKAVSQFLSADGPGSTTEGLEARVSLLKDQCLTTEGLKASI